MTLYFINTDVYQTSSSTLVFIHSLTNDLPTGKNLSHKGLMLDPILHTDTQFTEGTKWCNFFMRKLLIQCVSSQGEWIGRLNPRLRKVPHLPPQSHPTCSSWIDLDHDVYKLNPNAATSSMGMLGFGVVINHCEGNIMLSTTKQVTGTWASDVAESMVLLYGLQ